MNQDPGLRASGAIGSRTSLSGAAPSTSLPLDLVGTPFQVSVWKASSARIPYGETRTYAEVADAIGSPKAVRAVGSACGRNRIGLLVPCHRVLRQDGDVGGYFWGAHVKRRLIERERTGVGALVS